jgi:hypothetical protein
MVTVNVTTEQINGDTVKVARAVEYPKEIFYYDPTMADTDIVNDVIVKLQERGYIV